MTPETKFKTQIQKYLDEIGAYHVKQHGNKFTKLGVPDILICYRGKFIGLELKSEKGRPSPLQEWHIEQIKKAGGEGFILYPKDFNNFKHFCEDIEVQYNARKIL